MNMPIISNDQSFVISNPGKCSFDLPSFPISTKLSTILFRCFFAIRPMWANEIDTFIFKPVSQIITICCFIINKAFYLFAWAAATCTRNSYFCNRFFDERDFRGRCGVEKICQRNSFTIHHHHPLRTLSAFGFSDAEPPFLAGAKLPSAKHSSHFSLPFSSRADRYACQAFNKVPSSSHCHKRRQQVAGDGYSRGISFHRAPLRKSHKIPSNTGRFGIGFGPPLGEAFGSGKSGASFLHCSSFNSGLYRHIARSSFRLELRAFNLHQ
jgi:hypothetical protein